MGILGKFLNKRGYQMKTHPNYGHMWPIHHPEVAMADITEFLR